MEKLKVFYFVKKDKLQDGKTPIYGKIKLGSTSCTFSTGKYIDINRWKKTNGLKIAQRVDTEVSLKEYLNTVLLQLERTYTQQLKVINGNEVITATDLKNICFGTVIKKEYTLMEIIGKHNTYFEMQVLKGGRANGSKEKYDRMSEVIKQFLVKKYHSEDIEVSKIESHFVNELDHYLRFERKYGIKVGLGNNTTVKYIRNISVMLNYAVKHGYLKENPFKCYSETLEEVETVYLTKDELKKIEDKTFTLRRLDVIKDIFLFSCYTAYAPVDAMSLTWENIQKDGNGNLWIIRKRQKTDTSSNVLVLPQLKRILDKYKNDPECINSNRLIPNRSNTNVNAYLKEISDLCSINKNLTWYVARHTFATTVALENGMPLEVIAKIMGHKRITQTQHYAKILDKGVAEHMLRLATVLN